MAIKPICEKCKKELNEFGALLFSPPEKIDNKEKVRKIHLCKDCYQKILDSFR